MFPSRIVLGGAALAVIVPADPPAAAPSFVRIVGTGPHVEDIDRSYTAAWADYDTDGDLDLFVGAPTRLAVYRNEGNEIFVSVPGAPADTTPDIPRAPIFADFDDDGDLDLLQVTFGLVDSAGALVAPLPNALLRNDGGAYAHVPTSDDSSTSSTATFVDYDRDGDLDLFVSGQFLTQDLFYRQDPSGFTKLTTLPFLNTSTTGATENWATA